MTQQAKMQAQIVDGPGADFRLATIARPTPRAGEVLVRIHASGVNPLDTKIRAGAAAHARHPLPGILGMDLAGTVEQVGDGVDRFSPGDAVYAMAGGVGGVQGTLAEFAAVDADLLALKPDTLTMRQAASLPLVVITAWEGLVDRAHVGPGMKVLIHGGTGGVGHAAVQIASAFGAQVFATDRIERKAQIEGLGATFVNRADTVDAQLAEHAAGRGFDLVYDTVGGAVLDASFKLIGRFGHVVSCLGWSTHPLAPLSFKAGTYSGVFTLLPLLTGEGRAHHGDILEQAAVLVAQGKLKARIDPREFSLQQAQAAHQAVTDAGAAGKIVIDIT